MTTRRFFISRKLKAGSPFTGFRGRPEALDERYERLASLYSAALRDQAAVTTLEAPSIYQTREARAVIEAGESSAHLAVRPVADFRPMYGLANYLVFDGPVENLEGDVAGSLRTGIEIADAATRVFCTTHLLAEELRARGVRRATYLPPPVSFRSVESALPAAPSEAPAERSATPRLAAIAARARAPGGRAIYWDADESSNPREDLDVLLDAAAKARIGRDDRIVVAACAAGSRFGESSLRTSRRPDVIVVSEALTPEEKRLLASGCDIFLRLCPDVGLDLDVLAALENGVPAIVPEGHSATELADSRLLLAFAPRRTRAGLGLRSRRRCPDLVRVLQEAAALPAEEREDRGRHAAEWVAAQFGAGLFAARLRAAMGTS